MTPSIDITPRAEVGSESLAIHGEDGRRLVTVTRDFRTGAVTVSWPGVAGASPEDASTQAKALLLAIREIEAGQ